MTMASRHTSIETTDVVICGCGPTGAMLGNLLARHSIRTIILERDQDLNTDPRGIALDEDGIRYLQACGIYDKIFTDIGQCMLKMNFIGGLHHDLSAKPFLALNMETSDGGTGHPGFMAHKQPAIEKHLRAKLKSYNNAQFRPSSTLKSIHEDEEWVYATYTDASGQDRKIQSRFLVGADGKTGFVRKKYLEPRGVRLERVSQMHYEEIWVALNWKISLATPTTHPEFPLWTKGYSPQQVYDAFFPKEFRFLCNPKRSAVCGRFGLHQDRLWRFEYVVLPGEDPSEMAGRSKMCEIVYPYITHPGVRYGIEHESIQYPTDCIAVLRCRPFMFSARSCNKWALGRVMLCGDAAHVFPPFGGQGIASGFRDAMGLAWRLAIAVRERPERDRRVDHSKLFEGWYAERKQQLDISLAATIENGAYVTERNRVKIFVRDWLLWAIQLVPSLKRRLQGGHKRGGMTKYQWQSGRGMAFLEKMGGGGNFPQVYCAVLNGQDVDTVHFSDDVIFAPSKQCLLQVVVILRSLDDLYSCQQILAGVDEASEGALKSDEATFVLNSTAATQTPDTQATVYRLATGEEFAADEVLCRGRPFPYNYDPLRMAQEVGHRRFVIVRPDRFVFAACQAPEELISASKRLAMLFRENGIESAPSV
ncbi:FAD/NAD(P)-binding domain-containing protein [Periconia macrospinosa]|uniref:FAD/NAD(P)-binding domain-containing protein n=1 Tax=Periconia macrospinosa TaxID=97972 RepID=A0A2V1DDR4_9PLEO|nr:FAD/NAD(P)-binding domain-containing protein [Periconia macrospinosa]